MTHFAVAPIAAVPDAPAALPLALRIAGLRRGPAIPVGAAVATNRRDAGLRRAIPAWRHAAASRYRRRGGPAGRLGRQAHAGRAGDARRERRRVARLGRTRSPDAGGCRVPA